MSIHPFRPLALAATALVLLPTAQAQIWREDPSFAPEIVSETDITRSIWVRSDAQGRFLLGSELSPLTHVDGQRHTGFVRFFSDGRIDSTLLDSKWHAVPVVRFTTSDGGMWISDSNYSDIEVTCIPIEPDPNSDTWGTRLRKYLPDGSPDPDAVEIHYSGGTLILLPDDSIIIFGVARLETDSIPSGDPPSESPMFPPEVPESPERTHARIVRFYANGYRDPIYEPTLDSDSVRVKSILFDTVGRVHVWRHGSTSDGTFNDLVRLTPWGTIDPAFSWRVDDVSIEELVFTSDQVVTRSNTQLQTYDFNGQLQASVDLSELVSNRWSDVSRLQLDSSYRLYLNLRQVNVGQPNFLHILRLSPDLTVDHVWPNPLDQPAYVELLAISSDATLLVREDTSSGRRLVLADDNRWQPIEHQFTRRTPGSIVWIRSHEDTGTLSVWGDFSHINGQPRSGVARFLADGSLDLDFTAPPVSPRLALRDGGLIAWRRVEGVSTDPSSQSGYVHVSPTGEVTPLAGFPSEFANQSIHWLGESRDGKLMISRCVATDDDVISHIEALNLDGSVAWSFPQPLELATELPNYVASTTVPPYRHYGGIEWLIRQLIELEDGSWLLSSTYNARIGDQLGLVFRLQPDGSPMPDFIVDPIPDFVASYTRLEANGSIRLYGSNPADLTPANRLLLLDSNGNWVPTKSVTFPNSISYRPLINDPLVSPNLWPDVFLKKGSDPSKIDGFAVQQGARFQEGKAAIYISNGEPVPDLAPLFGEAAFPTTYGTFYRFRLETTGTEVVGPFDQAVTAGEPAVLAVSTTDPAQVSVQWFHDGVALPDETGLYLQFAEASVEDAGTYHAEVTYPEGTVTSATAQLTVAPNTTRLSNLSARSRVAADAPQTAGFVLAGSGNREVLVRSVGQTLGRLSGSTLWNESLLGAPDLVLDPNSVADDLLTALPATDASIVAVANRVGAFPVVDSSPTDLFFDGAALHGSLTTQPHTLQVGPADDSAGLSLLEIYDAGTDSARALTNVSLRATAGRGNDVLTGGFVLAGEGPAWVLIRAIGPSLESYGISSHIENPSLALFRQYYSSATTNDDWGDTPALAAATEAVGAFPLQPGSADAALLVKLSPGAYTAQVLLPGNEEPAEALLEIYFVGPSPVSDN